MEVAAVNYVVYSLIQCLLLEKVLCTLMWCHKQLSLVLLYLQTTDSSQSSAVPKHNLYRFLPLSSLLIISSLCRTVKVLWFLLLAVPCLLILGSFKDITIQTHSSMCRCFHGGNSTHTNTMDLMFLWPCIMNWPYKTTNVMHWILFIRQILLLSSTCFEYQVLIFRRT